jgi:hypothetical protein
VPSTKEDKIKIVIGGGGDCYPMDISLNQVEKQ